MGSPAKVPLRSPETGRASEWGPDWRLGLPELALWKLDWNWLVTTQQICHCR